MAPIPSKLRSATAGALSTSARALSLSSHLLEGLSGLLRPAARKDEPPEDREGTQERPWQESAGEREEAAPPTAEGPGPVPTAAGAVEPTDVEVTDVEVTDAEVTDDIDTTTTDPVAGVVEHARTFETHVEELADKPAAEVIRAVEHLSTDELERLYSHELRTKKRKTVIAAIEQSLTPGQG